MSEKNNDKAFSDYNDELIIEENTIYEIDLNCLECMKKRETYKKKNKESYP